MLTEVYIPTMSLEGSNAENYAFPLDGSTETPAPGLNPAARYPSLDVGIASLGFWTVDKHCDCKNSCQPRWGGTSACSADTGCQGDFWDHPCEQKPSTGLLLTKASCDFELACTWTNEGTTDWAMQSSAATNYVYLQGILKMAIYQSPTLDDAQGYTLTFAYYMKGISVGSLDVEVGDVHGHFHSIWRKSGRQGDDWQTASLSISASVAIRFVGQTQSSDMIGVDDVLLISQGAAAATTTTTTTTTTTLSLSCDFEVLCPWTNEGEIAWKENRYDAPTGSTGPSGAASGIGYIFVEASQANAVPKTAIFKSPALDNEQNYTLAFAYHMKGDQMGFLDVEVVNVYGRHSVWHMACQSG